MDSNLEEIDGFFSLSEFSRFQAWVEEQVALGLAVETPVEDYYAGVNFKERWFKFVSINETWRLVYPDAPFNGYWGQL